MPAPSIPSRPCIRCAPPPGRPNRIVRRVAPGTVTEADEEDIVLHKKALMIVAVALSAIVLAGFVSTSLTAPEPVSHYPNDRANHHPKSVNG